MFSRINWGESLEGAGCKLSPFGEHDTVDECREQTNCSARWRCAKQEGEVDIFGNQVPGGSPLIATDGTFNTSAECLCYMCDPDGAGCVVTDGVNGTHSESTCGGTCEYGYSLNAQGECSLTLTAPGEHAMSLEECQVTDPAQSSWNYGCFSKFTCRYGMCVGIPDDGENGPRPNEVIYDSMEACTCDVQCTPLRPLADDQSGCLFSEGCNPLPGVWRSVDLTVNGDHKTPNTVNLAGQINWLPPTTQPPPIPEMTSMPRYPNMIGTDGTNREWIDLPRVWYKSVQQHENDPNIPEGYPSLSIGFRRVDRDYVDVVIVVGQWSLHFHNYDENADPNGRPSRLPSAYMTVTELQMYAPVGECFTMPSLVGFIGQGIGERNSRQNKIWPLVESTEEFIAQPCSGINPLRNDIPCE